MGDARSVPEPCFSRPSETPIRSSGLFYRELGFLSKELLKLGWEDFKQELADSDFLLGKSFLLTVDSKLQRAR